MSDTHMELSKLTRRKGVQAGKSRTSPSWEPRGTLKLITSCSRERLCGRDLPKSLARREIQVLILQWQEPKVGSRQQLLGISCDKEVNPEACCVRKVSRDSIEQIIQRSFWVHNFKIILPQSYKHFHFRSLQSDQFHLQRYTRR